MAVAKNAASGKVGLTTGINISCLMVNSSKANCTEVSHNAPRPEWYSHRIMHGLFNNLHNPANERQWKHSVHMVELTGCLLTSIAEFLCSSLRVLNICSYSNIFNFTGKYSAMMQILQANHTQIFASIYTFFTATQWIHTAKWTAHKLWQCGVN